MTRAIIGAGVLAASVVMHCVIAFKVLPSFEMMFRDFGNASLPWITQVALSNVWRYGWLVWFIGVGGLGVFRVAIGKKPYLLSVALALGSGSWVVSIFAVYLPIFTLAGSIHD